MQVNEDQREMGRLRANRFILRRQLTKEGVSLLIYSTDYEELIGCCACAPVWPAVLSTAVSWSTVEASPSLQHLRLAPYSGVLPCYCVPHLVAMSMKICPGS